MVSVGIGLRGGGGRLAREARELCAHALLAASGFAMAPRTCRFAMTCAFWIRLRRGESVTDSASHRPTNEAPKYAAHAYANERRYRRTSVRSPRHRRNRCEG